MVDCYYLYKDGTLSQEYIDQMESIAPNWIEHVESELKRTGTTLDEDNKINTMCTITNNYWDGEQYIYKNEKDIPSNIEGEEIMIIGKGYLILKDIHMPKHAVDPVGYIIDENKECWFCWEKYHHDANYGQSFSASKMRDKDLEEHDYDFFS